MGCISEVEKLQAEMMKYRLIREDIIAERKKLIKELKKITGKNVTREPVPDFLILDKDGTPKFEKEVIEEEDSNKSEKKENEKKEKIVN